MCENLHSSAKMLIQSRSDNLRPVDKEAGQRGGKRKAGVEVITCLIVQPISEEHQSQIWFRLEHLKRGFYNASTIDVV